MPVAWKAAAASAPCRAAVVLLLLAASQAAADDIRVRIAWGGGADRAWQGAVSVSEGSLSEPSPLGIEADEPGSMWIDRDPRGGQSSLVIHQRGPRGYDGVDVSVAASPSARLLLRFSAADEPERPVAVEIPLADLSGEFINRELDNQGNRLLVMRAPGDSLRVRFSRKSLVFAPGEIFRFSLEPRTLPLPKGVGARFKAQLLDAGGKEHWSRQYDAPADSEEPISLEVPLPGVEGVYDIAITASSGPNWAQAVRQPLNWKRAVAERRVQVLVLDARPPAASPGKPPSQSPLVEIDPANPRWFEKLNKLPQLPLTKSRMPRLWKGPLGNNCLETREHALGAMAQLRPNADSPDVSWEAYWLPIGRPGRPHILEIDYPSDVPQTLGVSLLEPNAAGTLAPLIVDSGFDNAAPLSELAATPEWRRHRLIFWPRTDAPLLLLSNGRDRAPAAYGKIRVLELGTRPPPAVFDRAGANRRLLAAYLDRPLIPENFAAGESLDPWSGRSLDDWTTFHEGGLRLVEYLHYSGNNGLMLGVLADGSAIYPSKRLEPTPRYDTGAFFASGQDPIRKDVLEMLLRLFDRESLQLIPMLEFAAPLPELEAMLRAGGPAADGIEWIGADGSSLAAACPPRRGLAPYYNVLDPRVQEAMLRVARELVGRYAHHPSLSGIAIRLSADGYAQLPGSDWGFDDATIARFERDAKMRVPGEGPGRFAQRSAFLAEETRRRAWLDWRAAELAKFYRRVHDELVSVRPNSRLYLAGVDMFGAAELDASLRPSLTRRTTTASALLHVGIDARHYRDEERKIVLLRPERILPERNLGSRAVDLEIARTADFDRLFQGAAIAGSLFFHPPREWRAESFDRKNPFKPGVASLVSQPTPSDARNRKRFIHSLAALDSQVMIDGGCSLPKGQEAALRDLAAAYRALPAIRFQPIGSSNPADGMPPVIFRRSVHGGRTYLYAINDSPFAVTARLHVEAAADCRIEELTGARKISPLRPEAASGMFWEVSLAPYDLVAVQLSDPNAQCSHPQVAWPDAVEAALGMRIRRLGARAAALRNPAALDVLANADFEQSAVSDGQIPDWAKTEQGDVAVELDDSQKHGGRQSVKIASRGSVACLVSRQIEAPTTGRLAVSVWLRAADALRQPPLRLAVEARVHGREYYRFGTVGAAPNPGQPAAPILPDWGQYVFQVDDLPLEGISGLRVRFDLMGQGEVWVDDVQIYALLFSTPEMHELAKLITLADVKLQNGQIGDCHHLLEGYWPRFLEENVDVPAGAILSDAKPAKPRAEDEKPPERTGLLNRVKDLVPESLRF